MRITTKGRYALRAMIALAHLSKNGEIISISSLSEAEDISAVFLEQIFFKLKQSGIIKSIRGPGGGFSFNRPLDSISIREIFEASGEEMEVLPCDRQHNNCDRCSECISHTVLVSVTDTINNYLDKLSLQMVLENKQFKPRGRK